MTRPPLTEPQARHSLALLVVVALAWATFGARGVPFIFDMIANGAARAL